MCCLLSDVSSCWAKLDSGDAGDRCAVRCESRRPLKGPRGVGLLAPCIGAEELEQAPILGAHDEFEVTRAMARRAKVALNE
jgi:hypothetical protein